MTDRKALIAGHSHMLALGCPTWLTTDGAIQVADTEDPRFLALAGPAARPAAYQDEIVRLATDYPIVLVWAGQVHLTRFLFQDGPKFDLVPSYGLDLEVSADAELVPESVIRECFRGVAGLDRVLTRLTELPNSQTFVCGTPPPKNGPEFIRSIALKDSFWRGLGEKLGKPLDEVEIASPRLMLKLWSVWQTLLRESAAQYNARFVPVAPGVLDKEGFLRREFWGHDITHAWGGYGPVMREHIWSAIANRKGA